MWGDASFELWGSGLYDEPGPAVGLDPLYRGPDDHWLYGLRSGDLYSLAVSRRVAPAGYVAPDYGAAAPFPYIRISRSTPVGKADMEENALGYDDALLRIVHGQAGTPPAPGSEYYGGVDPAYRMIDLTQGSLFSPLRNLFVPPMSNAGALTTPRQARPAAAGISPLLLYGGLALLLVVLVRRK